MTKLGVSKVEADALMVELSNRGVIGPLSGMKGGSPWARSRIAQPAFRNAARNADPDGPRRTTQAGAQTNDWSVRYHGLWEHVALLSVQHQLA